MLKIQLKLIFLCDDIQDKYIPLNLVFGKVSSFQSNYSRDFNFLISGSYSAVCKQISGKKYQITFIFLLKENKRDVPAWEVVIEFENLRTTGGLNEEALAYKYEYA